MSIKSNLKRLAGGVVILAVVMGSLAFGAEDVGAGNDDKCYQDRGVLVNEDTGRPLPPYHWSQVEPASHYQRVALCYEIRNEGSDLAETWYAYRN